MLETTVAGATDIIVNFSGNIGIVEAYDAITYLTEVAGDSANIIFGTVENDSVTGEDVSITIIATGIESNQSTQSSVTPVSMPASKPAGIKTPTYSGQPITGAASNAKPSFLNQTSVKPNVATDLNNQAKPAPIKPQNNAASGIKIPDFLKRG